MLLEHQTLWIGNVRRFSTREEAAKYSVNLSTRWGSVEKIKILHTNDTVNFRWDDATRSAVPVIPS